MSQEEVFKILKKLGGEATISEIKKMVKEKYPSTSLKRLEKNNRVEKVGGRWRIKKKL